MKLTISIAGIFSLLLLGLAALFDGYSESSRLLLFFGRFHPVLLHVPIGALLGLGLLEIIHWVRPQLNLNTACSILLWFSAFSAIPAVIAGILLASEGGYNEELLVLHKWLGLGTAILCIWLLVLRRNLSRSVLSSFIYRLSLLINLVLLLFAGHYGGSLTHGSDYLTKYMPADWKAQLGLEPSESELSNAKIVELATDTQKDEAKYYVEHIQPLMDQYCYECHGLDKQKGNVRLDKLHWDMIGGPDAEGWHTVLDQINAGEMPPAGKAQPDDAQRIQLVEWMTRSLAIAAEAKRGQNKGVMRRLTKAQYTNTLRDLLDLPNDFGNVLPDDGKSKMGFSNNGEVLQISALHIDYYQKIAREALDKAIVFGDKPEPMRCRITFGEKLGLGKPAANFGGFQSAALSPEHFTVDLLNADGSIKTGANEDEESRLTKVKNNIGIGFRGSSGDRYGITPEGMILYSAIPQFNRPPKSWQGPSPNMKMVIKDDFPRGGGDFIMRVEAKRGHQLVGNEMMTSVGHDVIPAAITDQSIILDARDAENLYRMKLDEKGQFLKPDALTGWSTAEIVVKVPKEDFYQVDIIHPYASNDSMPSYFMKFGKLNKIQKRLKLNEDQIQDGFIHSPTAFAYLKEGEYKILVGGGFFVGLKQIILNPLPLDAQIRKDLEKSAERNREKYKDDIPSIRVFAGARTDDGMDYKNFDVTKVVRSHTDEFATYEFKGCLDDLPLPIFNPHANGHFANMMHLGLWNNHLVKNKRDSGPPLLVRSIELETPYFEQWPPKSHTRIFHRSAKTSDKVAYTREIIERFAEKAFRRELSDSEIDRYVNFWESIEEDYDRYEESVKEVLVAVLCSPHFLYLVDSEEPEVKEKDDAYYLASQLSYFLWNSAPDNELIQLAASGRLKEELPEQVSRMINDSRVFEMIRSFAYEWLRLDRLSTTKINVNKYRDYSRFVQEDLPNETYEFIHHVLREDLSIMNFIDSDFAMLNQNLAEFYGITGVTGNEFRAVPVEPNRNRGGLLSQGAFLAGHSDGIQAHPIKRAVWLKEKILGDPPPPAPPNVPEIDPDTPGFDKMTLKEQLELHRNKASCVDCHKKIDPYGIVFENYDAVGRYHTEAKGKPIDSTSVLPDGTEVIGIRGIKKYIQESQSKEFTRSLVEHLFAYALGRNISFADKAEIDAIVDAVCKDNYSFQTVIKEIVMSPSFTKDFPTDERI
ncbi:MAG: DUF1592 domain-containing protein [Coraliomargaritaceae bacterium]